MSNKKLIVGIAAGAAALATAAVFLFRKRAKQHAFEERVEEAKENMEGKLNELHKKAEKEVKSTTGDDVTMNVAKERANEWAKTANA